MSYAELGAITAIILYAVTRVVVIRRKRRRGGKVQDHWGRNTPLSQHKYYPWLIVAGAAIGLLIIGLNRFLLDAAQRQRVDVGVTYLVALLTFLALLVLISRLLRRR